MPRIDNKDPESLKEVNAIKITGEIKDFVRDTSSMIQQEKTSRAWWEQNIDKYRNLRYGIRTSKTFPWPNAANYVLPLIDADINRLKPAYANLINVSPMVAFEAFGPEDIEPARKREVLFDWRLKTKVNFFEPYILGIDYMLEQGAVIFKTTWKYSTRRFSRIMDLKELSEETLSALYDPRVSDEILEKILVDSFLIDISFEENIAEVYRVVEEFREGKEFLELDLVEKQDDQVEITPCSIRDDIVFPIGTTDLNQARFIDYIFFIPVNDVKIAMRDERYEQYDDDTIRSWAAEAPVDSRRRQAYRSQYPGIDSDLIWLHETCVWYDINNDGIDERCICTWPDADPSAVLRFIELPYDHGQWPYVLVKRELNDVGVFASRGVPALQEDFQNGISTAFNQSVDNGTITNTPQVVYRRNSVSNIRNIRYVPGQATETNGPTTDFEIRQVGNVSQGFLFQQAQYLKAWADQRLGNITAGLSAINNFAGQAQGGNKTKKEIDVIESLQAEAQSLELQVFQNQMAKVYYQADALFEQFADEDETIMITGEKPQTISRQEIQGKFNIVPNGRLDNSNPALRTNKSFMLLKAFLNDPDIRQRELKKLFLDDLDIKLSRKLFKTDEEISAEAQMAQQQQQAAKQQAASEMIQVRGMQDDMDIRKAALMTPIEGQKYAPG